MTRVLVTGAQGFIGSHVLAAIGGAVAFEGDVTRPEDWKPYQRSWDAVCHLAALVGTADSMARPLEYVRVNAGGTATMLQALRGLVGRVVLASSAAVYGECQRATEDAPVRPRSVYAATKRLQEQMVKLSGIPSVILRPFSVYGPGQSNPDGGLVGIFARRCLAGEPPLVTEDGWQLRDFVYVTDVAEAFRMALTAPPGTYNLGTGRETAVRDLAASLSRRLGAPEPVVTGELRDGDVRHLTSKRTDTALGWRAQVTLGFGLDRYCESLR